MYTSGFSTPSFGILTSYREDILESETFFTSFIEMPLSKHSGDFLMIDIANFKDTSTRTLENFRLKECKSEIPSFTNNNHYSSRRKSDYHELGKRVEKSQRIKSRRRSIHDSRIVIRQAEIINEHKSVSMFNKNTRNYNEQSREIKKSTIEKDELSCLGRFEKISESNNKQKVERQIINEVTDTGMFTKLCGLMNKYVDNLSKEVVVHDFEIRKEITLSDEKTNDNCAKKENVKQVVGRAA